MRMPFRLVLVGAIAAALSLHGLGLASAANSASGQKYQVYESFQSAIWTETCGFPVWRVNEGHERIWEEPRGGRGISFRGVFALRITLTGVESGKSYTFQDAGTDRERLLADGRTELAIIGRSFPVNSIGRLVEVDGEIVKVSGRSAYDPEAICARLAP